MRVEPRRPLRRLIIGVGASRSPKLQPLPSQRWQHPLWWETLRTAETARQEWAVQDRRLSYRQLLLTPRRCRPSLPSG